MSERLTASVDATTADQDNPEHLEPEAWRATFYSQERRLEYINYCFPWISYPEREETIKQIKDIYDQPDHKKTKENLLILAPATMDLSDIIYHFQEMVNTKSYFQRHAVVFTAPPYCNSRNDLTNTLFQGLKLRDTRTSYIQLEEHVRQSLRLMGTRVLFMLNIHNLLDNSDKDKRRFFIQLHVLCEELNLRLVMTSNERPPTMVRLDEQLDLVTRPWPLMGLKKNSMGGLVKQWLRYMPLPRFSLIMEDDWVQDRFYSEFKMSPARAGDAVKRLTCSAILRGSEDIGIEDFKEWRPSIRAAPDETTVPIKSPASSIRKRRQTVI